MDQPVSSPKSYLVDLIMNDRLSEAVTMGVMESEEHDTARKVGDTTLMNYMIKFEEYLDDHDIYVFDGWENAEFIQKPKVEKFWVTFWLLLDAKAEINGIRRITNTKEAQNKVRTQQNDDGSYVVEVQVLKRYLDAIEARNQQRSDELSDEELGRS